MERSAWIQGVFEKAGLPVRRGHQGVSVELRARSDGGDARGEIAIVGGADAPVDGEGDGDHRDAVAEMYAATDLARHVVALVALVLKECGGCDSAVRVDGGDEEEDGGDDVVDPVLAVGGDRVGCVWIVEFVELGLVCDVLGLR